MRLKKLVKFTLNKFKNIDVLINNAGIDQIKPFMDITDEDWATIIQVNLNSVFYCTQEVLENMIHNIGFILLMILMIFFIGSLTVRIT